MDIVRSALADQRVGHHIAEAGNESEADPRQGKTQTGILL